MSLYTWLREHTRHFYDLSTTRYNNWTTENNFTNIQYLEEYFYPMQPHSNDVKIQEYIVTAIDEKIDEIVEKVIQKLNEQQEEEKNGETN